MRLLFSSRQAPLTIASMFTGLTTTFRSAQTALLLPVTRPFSCIDRLRRAPVRSAEDEAAHFERQRLKRNAYARERYANDPDVRQRSRCTNTRYRDDPINRAKLKATALARAREFRDEYKAASHRNYTESLSYRRSKRLSNLVLRGKDNVLTWKTHTPIRYLDPVDHHCTGCNRDRLLMVWWQEKPDNPEVSGESRPDRYMCNRCFANDWPRVVPETYTGKLNGIFTSPELPLIKAQRTKLGKEKETESDKPQK